MATRSIQMEDSFLPTVHWPSSTSGRIDQLPKSALHRILVVDSTASGRQSLRSFLEKPECELLEVDSTTDALAAISSGRIDLILIDFNAPEIGAVEFCKVLRKADATQLIPIVVLSRESDAEREIAAIEAGANEFVARRAHPRVIYARVQANLWRKSVIDARDDSEAVLFSLAQSVEARDPELGQHCERIALMCAAMGVSLGLPPQDILALQRGGYLHDVGKVVIPDNILFKPGKLTAEEWRVMEEHTQRGERICSGMRSMSPVLPIIRHHHERWDGSGYPDKLKGEEIPLLARILQIADIYDALTTVRAYKPALSPESAVAILREEAAKGWRDPSLVNLFSEILPSFQAAPCADLTGYSLRALANSLESLRKSPGRAQTALVKSSEVNLVSGF